uniref:Ankyrin repeat and protein kinase domain-containing protein 1 n=1 Tax=Cacopsylla melanoneura TaxID=428564 RepID=A0A8D8ZUX4_9HEMI
MTALHYLHIRVADQDDNIARLLLKHGANVNVQNKDGISPLHYLLYNISGETSLNAARLLLQFGAKCDQKDQKGNTPLHLATERGDVNVARLLLEFGAKCDLKDQKGNTPLHLLLKEAM